MSHTPIECIRALHRLWQEGNLLSWEGLDEFRHLFNYVLDELIKPDDGTIVVFESGTDRAELAEELRSFYRDLAGDDADQGVCAGPVTNTLILMLIERIVQYLINSGQLEELMRKLLDLLREKIAN